VSILHLLHVEHSGSMHAQRPTWAWRFANEQRQVNDIVSILGWFVQLDT